MDIIVNKVSCYRSDENNFNMLFSFLETHCDMKIDRYEDR